MMLKEATIKNLELEMYEKRLTDVKIEMEKTRRRTAERRKRRFASFAANKVIGHKIAPFSKIVRMLRMARYK